MAAQNKYILKDDKNVENKFIFTSTEDSSDSLVLQNKYILTQDVDLQCEPKGKKSTISSTIFLSKNIHGENGKAKVQNMTRNGETDNVSVASHYDGGYGWFIVLGVVICNISFSLPALSFGVIYLEFLERFRHSAATTAFIGAINTMSIGLFGKYIISIPI